MCSFSAVNIRNGAEIAAKTASLSVPYGPTTAKRWVPVQKWFTNAKVGAEGSSRWPALGTRPSSPRT